MNLNKLLISISYLMFLLCTTIASHSQPYQSLFGKNTTQWITEWGNLFGYTQDTIFVDKDTVVGGTSWKTLRAGNNNVNGIFSGALIREDTMAGKVWYKSLDNHDSVTKLAFDFTLQIGDSFDITSVWGNVADQNKIVDTVYYENGRKVIVFKELNFKSGERFNFIEGIGSNLGIIYKHYYGLLRTHYLLCGYKDGLKVFSNKYYNGQCKVHFPSAIQEIPSDLLEIFPNPVKDKVYLKTASPNLFTGIRIINSLGEVIVQHPFQNVIAVSEFPTGFYIIQLTTKAGKTYSKKLIFQ